MHRAQEYQAHRNTVCLIATKNIHSVVLCCKSKQVQKVVESKNQQLSAMYLHFPAAALTVIAKKTKGNNISRIYNGS